MQLGNNRVWDYAGSLLSLSEIIFPKFVSNKTGDIATLFCNTVYVLKRNYVLSGDNYVHRLIQNKGDGKLVEVDEGGNVMQTEKVDSIQLEVSLKTIHGILEPVWSIDLLAMWALVYLFLLLSLADLGGRTRRPPPPPPPRTKISLIS